MFGSKFSRAFLATNQNSKKTVTFLEASPVFFFGEMFYMTMFQTGSVTVSIHNKLIQ